MIPPNILLILCHDLGQRLGCYGVCGLKTPVIDQFANDAVLFENYFATAPLCSPSRGSIMTGLYPHTNGLMGLVNRGWDMPDTYPTLAQLLRGNGYAAELFGGSCCADSLHTPHTFHTPHTPVLFGFHHEKTSPSRMGYVEHRHARGPHTWDTVVAEFLEWRRVRRSDDPPYFACLGFFEVHRVFKHERYTPDDPAQVEVPPYLPDTPEVREDLADLHGMIFAVDAAMERLLADLENGGATENTWVIFSTDHGLAFPRAKSTLYDPGLATALIMRCPARFDGGGQFSQLLSNIDLAPTLLEGLGIDRPPYLQGRSFFPLLSGGNYEPRASICAEKTWHDAYDPIRAVRTDRYKYIRNFPGESGAPPEERPALILPADIEASLSRQALARLGDPHLVPRPEEELYDLQLDPNELENRSGDSLYQNVRDTLSKRLDRWMADTGDPLLQGFVPCPDREKQSG